MNTAPLEKIESMPGAERPRFRGQILARIYRVWLLRKLAPVLAIEVALVSLVLYKLGQTVFIQQVIQNALGVLFTNPAGIFRFIAAAFTNAAFATKVLAVAFVVIVAFFIRHATQGMLRYILVRQNFFGRAEGK